MPITEESKQSYLQARDVFVESYKDFLRKLLGLLDEAEQTTEEPAIRQDVAHFAGEVKLLQKNIDDFQNEEVRAKLAILADPSTDGSPDEINQDEQGRASSPGEDDVPEPQKLPTPPKVPTTTSSPPKFKTQSQDSADELQAEVESAPSQVTASEEAEEAPQVFAPPVTDDGRVVSAFCAFRYHKAEFRQLFMRQGSNNNSCCPVAAMINNAAALSASGSGSLLDAELVNDPPSWLGPLAQYTLHLMRRAFRTATPEQWEALKLQLAGLGFRAEEHFALWLRLSTTARDGATQDPGRVFNAIPPLAGLPKRLAHETGIMLQTLNLISG